MGRLLNSSHHYFIVSSMKGQQHGKMLKPSYSSMLKIICFFLLILFGIICFYLLIQSGTTTVSQNNTCPFDYLYHFGDGVTDIGNSIHVQKLKPNPAARPPYGRTFPGYPTGRWSDGLIDFDYTSESFGLPNIVPYLTMNKTEAEHYNGVIFSVARSPVLDRKFFESRNIVIPDYAVPLHQQLAWFKDHLKTICTSRSDCSKWIGHSLVLMGDIEGNDIGYALTQGKTIDEVREYVPYIVNAIMDATRETIKLGAKRLIIPGNGPLGCAPYILTALQTNVVTAYDELGCLKSVNDFTIWKNDYLQKAISSLSEEFPDVQILFGPMYDGVRTLIANASVIGPSGNKALKSCCGTGGKYNYNPKKFCGDKGVPVCKNPNEHIYWDGLHFTQQTHWEIEDMLVRPALVALNCTSLISDSVRSMRCRSNVVANYGRGWWGSSYYFRIFVCLVGIGLGTMVITGGRDRLIARFWFVWSKLVWK